MTAEPQLGVPVPLTGQIMEIMQALRVDGKQKDDHGGVIQFYVRLAGVKVRAGGSPA
jgi:2-hydroxy-3-oxopropionate reductase